MCNAYILMRVYMCLYCSMFEYMGSIIEKVKSVPFNIILRKRPYKGQEII